LKRALPRVRRRFFFAAASVLLIAVVQQAIDLNLSGREEVLHQFHALQNLLARQEVHEAVSYLQACTVDLHGLAALPSVQHHDGARIPADVQAYYRSGDHPRPTAIEVVNEQGAVVASSPASAGTNDYAGSPLLKWATGEASRGQVFFCPSPHTTKDPKDSPSERQFLLVTPLYPSTPDSPASSEASAGSGVLVMTVDLESVLTEHLAILSPKAATHRVWMMDQDGTILLQSEHPEMARENIFRVRPECVQCHVSFDYAQRMLGQERGITEYQLRDQPRKLAAFAPMRFANASWVVVVNAPYTAVTSFARRSFGQVLLLLVMLALALTLVSALVHQSNVSRMRAEQEAQGWQEKHHLQELIQRAEARYRTLFEQSPDGVLMIDPQTTRPLEFSEAAHRQLGYSRSEFAGLRLCDYEAIETCSATQAQFARLGRDGHIRFETRHRTRQGESRNVEVIGRTLNLAGRTVFHCIYHDITERKRSEESLHRRSAQLEDLHRANLTIAIKNAGLLEQVRRDAAVKTTLLNEVNHRVKNNLMRLAEIVRLGYEHVPPSEIRLRAALQDLRNRLQGMAVVHTMLSTARWSPLPLSELVTQVVEAALHGASAHPVIRVTVDAPVEALVVPEQATAVALILNELATNSLKHALGNRAEARVEVRVHVEDRVQGRPLVRLEYRDDGPGWPEAVLHGQIDTLGLSLIQATVRSPLRGRLTLSNRAGAVAALAFHLALPA
jgi:PAS domain S-box-containing protein